MIIVQSQSCWRSAAGERHHNRVDRNAAAAQYSWRFQSAVRSVEVSIDIHVLVQDANYVDE
jgi:hypothetical protein